MPDAVYHTAGLKTRNYERATYVVAGLKTDNYDCALRTWLRV